MITLIDFIQIALGVVAFLGSGILICGARARGSIDWITSALIYGVAIALIPMVLLGYFGWFMPSVVQLIPWLMFVVLLAARRRSLFQIKQVSAGHVRHWGSELSKSTRVERLLLFTLMGILSLCFVSICLTTPAIYDSLSYRLPRIANWFQNGSIAHFEVSDERQNWMPVVPDLMMAWIYSHNQIGFYGVQLAQFFGGLLALTSLYQLGRICNLSRVATLAGLLFFASLPSVFVQLMSSHTDLVTAGFTLAGIVYLQKSLHVNRFSPLAGLAWALAFGSKGILFYWVIGLPYLLGYLIYRYRPSVRVLALHAVAFLGFSAVFFFPKHIENQVRYGNPFAETELMDQHHESLSLSRSLQKTYRNAFSYLTQLNEPYSNHAIIRSYTTEAGIALAQQLPTDDLYLFDNSNRRATWRSMFDRVSSDSDAASFGVIQAVLMIVGMLLLCASQGCVDSLLRHLGISVFLFLLYFCYKQNGHAYAFRYFVIIAGPLALVAMSCFERLPHAWRGRALVAVLILPVTNLFGIWINNSQLGYNNISQAHLMRDLIVYNGTKGLARSAEASRLEVIYLDVDEQLLKAGFYSAGGAVRDGAIDPEAMDDTRGLITSSSNLKQMMGLYDGRTLFMSLPNNVFQSYSLLSRPAFGENPRPFIYGFDYTAGDQGFVETYSIYSNEAQSLTLELRNDSSGVHHLQWIQGERILDFKAPGNAVTRVEVPLGSEDTITVKTASLGADQQLSAPLPEFTYRLLEVNYPNEF